MGLARDRAELSVRLQEHHTGNQLMPSFAFDRSERFKDVDGRLHVRVSNLSKATVNPYRGSEIPNWQGLGLDPDKVYHLLRDPAELAKGAHTFNNLPLMSRHVIVSAADPHERHIAGSTGTDAAFNDPYLTNSLVVWRQEDIDDIESRTKCELSCAYRYDAVMGSGTFEGLPYDGKMCNIVGNHVALVEEGRAGPDVLVHDSKDGLMPYKSALTSRMAIMVKGGLLGYLHGRTTVPIALDAALMDVTRANWPSTKETLKATVARLATPKLAKDANLEDLHAFIDRMDKENDGAVEDDDLEGMDESERAEEMEAREREAEDGMSPEDRLKARDRRRGARDAKRAADKKAADKAKDKKAKDAEPEKKDEKAEREEAEDRKAKDAKAMDAALDRVRVETEAAIVARFTAAAQAREDVQPIIGRVSVAMDSAPAIYKLALDHLNVDLTGVPTSAYRAVLKAIPQAPKDRPKIAMDAMAASSLASRFPALAAIRIQ